MRINIPSTSRARRRRILTAASSCSCPLAASVMHTSGYLLLFRRQETAEDGTDVKNSETKEKQKSHLFTTFMAAVDGEQVNGWTRQKGSVVHPGPLISVALLMTPTATARRLKYNPRTEAGTGHAYNPLNRKILEPKKRKRRHVVDRPLELIQRRSRVSFSSLLTPLGGSYWRCCWLYSSTGSPFEFGKLIQVLGVIYCQTNQQRHTLAHPTHALRRYRQKRGAFPTK
jgi:hypothetical protein